MKPIKYILFLSLMVFLMQGCSLLRSDKNFKEIDFPQDPQRVLEFSLIKHFNIFKKNNKKKLLLLKKKEERYFSSLANSLIKENKNFFKKLSQLSKINFYFLKSRDVYFFSVPRDGLFMTTQLFAKYIENEDVFVSLILFELVRMEYNLYPKRQKVSVGDVSDSQIIKMTQIQNMETRLNIHEWSYRLMRRTDFDHATYLLWQQIMIRNNKKFEKHLGNYKELAREERKLKSFVIGIEKDDVELEGALKARKTPKVFYDFIKRIDV